MFWDEVQEITGWEKVVNSLNTDFDLDIYNSTIFSDINSIEMFLYES